MKQTEGYTAFEDFNSYVDNIKPLLDRLLVNWKVLEIVNLNVSEGKRYLYWKP